MAGKGGCPGRGGYHHVVTLAVPGGFTRVCAHCQRRMGKPWHEPTLNVSQRDAMVASSRAAHNRLCGG